MITIGIEEYASHVFGGGGLIDWGDRFDDKLRPTGGGSAFVEIESTGAAGGAAAAFAASGAFAAGAGVTTGAGAGVFAASALPACACCCNCAPAWLFN